MQSKHQAKPRGTDKRIFSDFAEPEKLVEFGNSTKSAQPKPTSTIAQIELRRTDESTIDNNLKSTRNPQSLSTLNSPSHLSKNNNKVGSKSISAVLSQITRNKPPKSESQLPIAHSGLDPNQKSAKKSEYKTSNEQANETEYDKTKSKVEQAERLDSISIALESDPDITIAHIDVPHSAFLSHLRQELHKVSDARLKEEEKTNAF